MSIGLVVSDLGTLESIDVRVKRLQRFELRELLEGVCAEVESQTRRRIMEEKRAPDGTEWREWSPSYAARKHGAPSHEPHPGELREAGGHSLLQLTGALVDSIQSEVEYDEGYVGSNLEYANAQQAERPYLGISEQNKTDIDNVVRDFLDELL